MWALKTFPALPPSASYVGINFLGGLAYLAVLILGMDGGWFGPDVVSLLGLFSAVAVILVLEVVFLKVHRRGGGMRDSSSPGRRDFGRIGVKLVGFVTALALVCVVYALAAAAFQGGYMQGVFHAIEVMAVPYVPLVAAYIVWYDRYSPNPEDSLWKFGAMVVGKAGWTWREIFEFFRSVLLRAFFAPMMLSFFLGYTGILTGHGIELYVEKGVTSIGDVAFKPLIGGLLVVYVFFCSIDVLFAAIGYLFPMKAVDSDIKSTETSVLGWLVCLVCYEPFFTVLFYAGICQAFFNNPQWFLWFSEYPYLLALWGGLAILANILEASTTMTFGVRFSNLGYRGLITSGAFRFTKHPQYVSKIMNRFLVYVPFLSLGGLSGSFLNLAGFLVLCLVYYLRARTEENYLSRKHPEYVAYATLMNGQSVFRGVASLLPFLRYSEDKAKRGRLF